MTVEFERVYMFVSVVELQLLGTEILELIRPHRVRLLVIYIFKMIWCAGTYITYKHNISNRKLQGIGGHVIITATSANLSSDVIVNVTSVEVPPHVH